MRENSHHIWHPPCTDFSLANFSHDGHNRQFSNPCHGALFNSRDTEVIPNRRINLVFGHYHYCGWLATAGPVTNVSSLLSKQQTQHLTEPTFMASSPHMLLRSLWIYWTGAFCSTCTSTFTILYCYCGDNTCMEHRWSWCGWGVSLSSRKARNSTQCHIKKEREKKERDEKRERDGEALFSYWHSYSEDIVQCQHLPFWPQSDESLLSHCKICTKSDGLSTGPPVLTGTLTSTSNQTGNYW